MRDITEPFTWAFPWSPVEQSGYSLTGRRFKQGFFQLVFWFGKNTFNRDFRTYTFGLDWNPETLSEQGPGEYVASVPIPTTGATVFMIELEYLVGGPGGIALKFTTGVSVVQIPEPTSCALLIAGLTIGIFNRRGVVLR